MCVLMWNAARITVGGTESMQQNAGTKGRSSKVSIMTITVKLDFLR